MGGYQSARQIPDLLTGSQLADPPRDALRLKKAGANSGPFTCTLVALSAAAALKTRGLRVGCDCNVRRTVLRRTSVRACRPLRHDLAQLHRLVWHRSTGALLGHRDANPERQGGQGGEH